MLPWLMAGGALLGAIAGGQGSGGQSETTNRNLMPEGDLEKQARLAQSGGFSQLEAIQNGQLGQQASQASNAYADILGRYQQTGGAPSQADFSAAGQYAQQATAPQQAQIELAMRNAQQGYAQQAGLSGRRPTDFALQTKLNQQRSDSYNQLGAQQTAMGAQYAQQLSQNRLGYAGDLANLRQGLASQAMNNRMAIMGLGSQIQGQQMNFRTANASQTSSRPGQSGGLMGALTGAFQGAGAGIGMANAFGSFGGGGGSASPQAASPTAMNFGPGLQMPTSSVASMPIQYGLGGGGSSGASRGLASVSAPASYTQPLQSQPMPYAPGLNQPWSMQQSVYEATSNAMPFWQR